MRKEALVTGQVYHIFSKSIAGFKIFNNEEDYSRYILSMRYYMRERTGVSFCNALKEPEVKKGGVDILVQIIAYSTMPTHIHFALKQLKDKGITTFMRRFLDSYTRYFNIKHNRKGPLWEGKFKNVLVSSDEQLLHLSRYIHLNPVAALLVDKPEEWGASSYKEYLSMVDDGGRICDYDKLLEIDPAAYKSFVEDRVSYQRDLAKIEKLILE